MIERRALFALSGSALLIGSSVEAKEPEPAIFSSISTDAAEIMRAAFLKRMAGQFIPSARNAQTRWAILNARYKMEFADLEIRPDAARMVYDLMIEEIAHDLSKNYPQVRLVALDGYFDIDSKTYQPVFAFYIEHNV